jgi:hypothetical protein
VKLDHVQIDVYTSFRDAAGHADPRCILSTDVERSEVEHIDWEATEASEFVEITGGRFALSEGGDMKAIEPLSWRNGSLPGQASTPTEE